MKNTLFTEFGRYAFRTAKQSGSLEAKMSDAQLALILDAISKEIKPFDDLDDISFLAAGVTLDGNNIETFLEENSDRLRLIAITFFEQFLAQSYTSEDVLARLNTNDPEANQFKRWLTMFPVEASAIALEYRNPQYAYVSKEVLEAKMGQILVESLPQGHIYNPAEEGGVLAGIDRGPVLPLFPDDEIITYIQSWKHVDINTHAMLERFEEKGDEPTKREFH